MCHRSCVLSSSILWVLNFSMLFLFGCGVNGPYRFAFTHSASTLTVNASSVQFGSVLVHSTVSQSVTLTSAGTAPVVISSIATTGTGFSVSNIALPITLNPGETAVLNIEFGPAASGSFTGSATITSNSSSGPIELALSGTCFAHQVALSWAPVESSSDPVMGYNVYRMILGSAAYSKINTALVTTTSYADQNVAGGSTYDYYVTSVDGSGRESLPSNTSQAVVP